MLRHLLILLPPSIAALLAWIYLPGTVMDASFFSTSSKVIAKPPFFITGNGKQETPHTLRTLRSAANLITEQPISITITDDPEQIFQSSPPSPIDYAVILKNISRLGSKSVSISTPLAWQEADMISLLALDRQLDAYPSPITSAPLTRSPVPSPIPPAFRRASIPITSIDKGEITSFPIINRISIPNVVLGNKTSLAGFSILESEVLTQNSHLIARWDDRIVFSFLLLTALDHFGKKIDEITIKPDQYISLSNSGPYIPIDSYGRLKMHAEPIPRQNQNPIPATDLIDAPDDLIAHQLPRPIVLTNSLSSIDESERLYSESIVSTIATLCHPEGTTYNRSFPRFPWISEILFLASLNCMLFSIFTIFSAHRRFCLTGFLVLILASHFIIFTTINHWPPTLPAIIAVLITFLMPNLLPQMPPSESPEPHPHEPN